MYYVLDHQERFRLVNTFFKGHHNSTKQNTITIFYVLFIYLFFAQTIP